MHSDEETYGCEFATKLQIKTYVSILSEIARRTEEFSP
jgi:hypothetical protein